MTQTFRPRLRDQAQAQDQAQPQPQPENQHLMQTYGIYTMIGIGIAALLFNLRSEFLPITSPFIFLPLWMSVALFTIPKKFKKLPKQVKQLLTSASIMCVSAALLFVMSPARACAGWLCGARDTLASSDLLQGITGGEAALTAIWIALQLIAVLVIGGLIIWAIARGLKEQDLAKPIIALVVVLITLFISNYVTDWIVGGVTAGAGG